MYVTRGRRAPRFVYTKTPVSYSGGDKHGKLDPTHSVAPVVTQLFLTRSW